MLELQMHEAHLLRRQKMTVSQIADELGCSQRTVYYYLSESPRARKKRVYTSKLDRFKPYIDSVIEETPDYNREVLLADLKNRGYEGGITILRDYAAKVSERVTRKAVIRFETVPGLQAQVDWKDAGRRTIDGTRRKVYAFNMVLGYSRTPFTIHTTCMDQATVLACHVLAFRHFGGVPQEILYDNMKTAFIRDSDGRWKPNKHLLRLANHYGFVPKRCRIRRPETKGKVERYIRTYEDGFLRYLEDGLGIDEMNDHVDRWIDRLMNRKMRDFDATRRERLTQDLKAMLPLPTRDFDVRRQHILTVSRESTVTYRSNRFSVPPKYIGRQLILRIHPLEGDGHLYDGEEAVREIPRLTSQRGSYWREQDRQELRQLWMEQSGPRSQTPVTVASEPVVYTRSPGDYDKLMGVPA